MLPKEEPLANETSMEVSFCWRAEIQVYSEYSCHPGEMSMQMSDPGVLA